MDVRSFFTPKTKTETKTETETNLLAEIREMARENEMEQEEAYRQGFKDGHEEGFKEGSGYDFAIEMLNKVFEFSPTLHDIANRHPTMSLADKNGDMLYRHPTKTELDQVVWEGPEFRFPIAYTWDGIEYATYRACLTGKTWTLREFLERAQLVYTAQKGKHLKANGDHIFFEGFDGDTFHCGS
jgi:hypothetical protein